MYKQLLPVMVLLQLSTPTHAIDLNTTAEIISQASEATENLQGEINAVITEVPIVTTTIPPATVLDTNQSMAIKGNEESETPIQIEEVIRDNNISTVNEIPNNLAVPTILPTESLVKKTVEANNSTSQDTNNSLNKETFDMSKGDANKGKKIFMNKFKEICAIKGSKFAAKHSQDEWEELAEEGEFEEKIFKLCPKIESTYKKEWSPDLYQFYYENANDSEHIPEC